MKEIVMKKSTRNRESGVAVYLTAVS